MENLFFIIKILKDDNKKFEDIYTNYKNLIDIFIKNITYLRITMIY